MESTENYASDITCLCSSYINILGSIFKECPEGIVFRDKNLCYRMMNEAFCKFYNIKKPENLIGTIEPSFLPEEKVKIIYEVNQEIKKEKRPINFIMNIGSEEKEIILNIISTPIIVDNEFQGIISIVKDITQDEYIKEKFVFKHFQLKSLLENIPMLIYMQDSNLNYIAGTKPSQDFVKEGYDAFSNIKLDLSKNEEEGFKENRYVLENNKIITKEKMLYDAKDVPHWYKIYKVPINNHNGDVTGIITLANNIDAEKHLQTQRENFVASLGHDLKNPTIAQIRSLELLQKGSFGELKAEQREIIDMVLDSCRYMYGMLSTLLATYRNDNGGIKLNFAEFSFPELVNECVSEMIYVAKDKGIIISIDKSLGKETILADRVQIKRVIMNLLSNGIKYAFKDSNIKLNLFQEKGKIGFEFENSSPYIPLEKQDKIFAKYVSYACSFKEVGSGLGLYASREIINNHQGKLYLKSFKDDRNIFGFKIPIRPKKI